MKKVLVVDDDEVQRDVYVEVFKDRGYEVISAGDGLEGFETALKAKPNLIFTGIIMPRMDGFELIHNLRGNVMTSEIPIIMFSHLGREEDRAKAKALSNISFFVKGMDKPGDIAKKAAELMGV